MLYFKASSPVEVASNADSMNAISTSALIATISDKSSRRPSDLVTAAAAPSAIPFISSSHSWLKRFKKKACANIRKSFHAFAGALGLGLRWQGGNVINNFGSQ